MFAGLLAGAATPGDDTGMRQAREARGRYIAESVGMCQDCHSPRNDEGAFVVSEWLGGAPIGFAPLGAMPWADAAPPIAGLPTMTDDQAVLFLTTGEKPDGSSARPPMPEYRMSREDAQAVVAYLRSLSPAD
ncbi:MAG: hypothetical protein LJF30_12075 [Acidobacteria bacterium]|nr:hypothetical protein [Acidobacteriota bacterium]